MVHPGPPFPALFALFPGGYPESANPQGARRHNVGLPGVADVQRLVGEAEQAATPEEQAAKLKEANTIIATEAASNWLYLYPQIVVASSEVSGFPVNGLNSQFYVYNITKA